MRWGESSPLPSRPLPPGWAHRGEGNAPHRGMSRDHPVSVGRGPEPHLRGLCTRLSRGPSSNCREKGASWPGPRTRALQPEGLTAPSAVLSSGGQSPGSGASGLGSRGAAFSRALTGRRATSGGFLPCKDTIPAWAHLRTSWSRSLPKAHPQIPSHGELGFSMNLGGHTVHSRGEAWRRPSGSRSRETAFRCACGQPPPRPPPCAGSRHLWETWALERTERLNVPIVVSITAASGRQKG